MKLVNARISLWLEPLRSAPGPNLLLLHALGGSSADFRQRELRWPGSVYALDFCGHGRSGRSRGGGYLAELLVSDADAALAQLGSACVLGEGIGAYVGLLLAGARPQHVSGVALRDGAGLAGCGAEPLFDLTHGTPQLQPLDTSNELQAEPHTDPVAVMCLNEDPRPPEYAAQFAAAAARILLLEDERPRPAWWQAVAATPRASRVADDFSGALRALAASEL